MIISGRCDVIQKTISNQTQTERGIPVEYCLNPLPLKYAFLRTYTLFKKYEFLKAIFSLNKIFMHSLHAKYTDE